MKNENCIVTSLFDFLVEQYDTGDLCEAVHECQSMHDMLVDATGDEPAQMALAALASMVPTDVWESVETMILDEFDE